MAALAALLHLALSSCDLPSFAHDDAAAVAVVRGALHGTPVRLSGWPAPKWGEGAFLRRFGDLPLAPPIPGAAGAAAAAAGRPPPFFPYVAGKAGNVLLRDYFGAAAKAGALPVLFTYEAHVAAALRDEFEVPRAVAAAPIPAAETVLVGSIPAPFLSVGQVGTSHFYHIHEEAWLGLASGAKRWWFMPPRVEYNKAAPRHVLGYGAGQGAHNPPVEGIAGQLRCDQRPGDVLWFPAGWWHATMSLEHWTVGVGAQFHQAVHFSIAQNKLLEDAASDAELAAEGVDKRNDVDAAGGEEGVVRFSRRDDDDNGSSGGDGQPPRASAEELR